MYWRNTPQNLNLSQALIKEPYDWTAYDQLRVNALFKSRAIRVTILLTRQFPNGSFLKKYDGSVSNDTVVAHANWTPTFADKKELLARLGLWLLD